MRVASNKLNHVLDYYLYELKEVYDESEIRALFTQACAHFLNYTIPQVKSNLNSNINQSDLLSLYDCCKALKQAIPIQYVLNEAWFYNLKFEVNSSVLIPRSETEELVHLILKENLSINSLLDIGTGSGCIAVAIKKNRLNTKIHACDISPEAIKVARRNSIANAMEINFFEADILNEQEFNKRFSEKTDIIVSNPPYIKSSETKTMHKNVIDNEPHLALFARIEDDILFYKKIINCCKTHLNNGGKLYFELNPQTASQVKEYAIQSGLFTTVNLINDMSFKNRFLKAEKANA